MSKKSDDANRLAHKRLMEVAGRQYANRHEHQAALATTKAEFLGQLVMPCERLAYGEFDVELVRWGYIGQSVEVLARVWRNGRQLGFGRDGMIDIERFRFNRLAMYVPDPTGDMLKTSTDLCGRTRESRILKFDPREALLKVLTQAAAETGKDSGLIVPGTIGSTTYTLYPTYGTDGYVAYESATYSTAREGGGTGFTAVGAESGFSYGQYKNGSAYGVIEAFAHWPLTGVSGTINSATISTMQNNGDFTGTNFTAEIWSHASWSDPFTSSAFIAGGSLSGQTLYASLALTAPSDDVYQAFTSQAALLTAITSALGDDLYVMISSDRTRTNNTPTQFEFQNCYSTDYNGVTDTTQDPKLVIDATAPPVTGGFFMFM